MDEVAARAASTAAAATNRPLPTIVRSLSTSTLLESRRASASAPVKNALSTVTPQRRHSGSSARTATRMPKTLRCSWCACDVAQAQEQGGTRATATTLRRVKRDELLCSICFDILCFPVTLPCGHNFDRGCILAAWRYNQPTTAAAAVLEAQQRTLRAAPENDPVEVDDGNETANEPDNVAAQSRRRNQHLCPLCRQEAGICNVNELQVNLLLKDVIANMYPLETECAATLEKKQWAARVVVMPQMNRGAGNGHNARTQYSFRAVSSFVYVCVASVTDPPGFVLAVLLLMGLIAIACNPQPMLANNASAATLTLFDVMDHVFNGFSLLIREFSLTLDQLEQLKPWIHAFSFML